jgi:hypothetical protein
MKAHLSATGSASSKIARTLENVEQWPHINRKKNRTHTSRTYNKEVETHQITILMSSN